MSDEKGHAALILVLSTDGVPMVFELSKPLPHWWKLPGGRKDNSETPEETAIRELEEEIGLVVDIQDLNLLIKQDMGSHYRHLYSVQVDGPLTCLKKTGDEGELVAVFQYEEINKMIDFFPNHRDLLLSPEVQKKLLH